MATGLPLASMIGYLQRRARPLWTSCRRLRAKTVNSHERPEYSDDPSVRSAGTRSHLRQHRRDDGQHAVGSSASIVQGRRHRGRCAAETRILQSAGERQGSYRREHDPGVGAARQDQAGLDIDRADVGQYRDCAGIRGGRAWLSRHPDHAGFDVDRAAQDASVSGRRAALDTARAGHEGSDGARRGTAQGNSGLGDARTIHQPGQPRDSPQDDGRGNLA